MTHTPAPWSNRGGTICAPHPVTPGTYQSLAVMKARKNAEANARLIAAAPELLEALKLLAIAKYKGPAHLTEALWENAYAAIAKAEEVSK